MQEEALRIQRQMYIRIKDLELMDLSKGKIFQIMLKQGTPRKTINNLMNGRFTPVNYSKVRFENKVNAVKDQMKRLNKDSDEFIYSANRDFLFPRRELEKVKSAYNGLKFFDETYNEETGKMEGGYYPDREKYQTDKDGDLMYSPETGKPMLEEGFIKRQIRKIPGAIKDLVLPGSPGLQVNLDNTTIR